MQHMSELIETLENMKPAHLAYTLRAALNEPLQIIDNVILNNRRYRKVSELKANWQGWKKLETEIASQEKADKALSDAKAYVQENFTNQKLTVLTGTNAIQDFVPYKNKKDA